MNPIDRDMAARLERLQAKVTQFGELADRLAAALPPQVEGTDSSGRVQMMLAVDGLPNIIRVRDGWERRIEANRLATAIMDANNDALRRGIRAWSDRLDDTRWWDERARTEVDGPGQLHADPPCQPAGTVREPSELTEDVLKALHTVQQQRPPTTGPWEGSDLRRHVNVILGPSGLTDCRIDPAWAARQGSEAITTALNQALKAAKAAMPAKPGTVADADQLLADTLATLRALTDPSQATGETR